MPQSCVVHSHCGSPHGAGVCLGSCLIWGQGVAPPTGRQTAGHMLLFYSLQADKDAGLFSFVSSRIDTAHSFLGQPVPPAAAVTGTVGGRGPTPLRLNLICTAPRLACWLHNHPTRQACTFQPLSVLLPDCLQALYNFEQATDNNPPHSLLLLNSAA